MNVPECSVCLQAYNDAQVVPRVLACGHSLCEACLASLARPSPSPPSSSPSLFLLRCPECSHSSKLPATGPRGLPKNIELLRCFRSNTSEAVAPPHPSPQQARESLGGPICVDDPLSELYRWIIPQSSARLADETAHPPSSDCGCSSGHVSVFPWDDSATYRATFFPICRTARTPTSFDYTQRARSALTSLSDERRKDLLHLLRISRLPEGACSIFGFWMSGEGHVHLVCRAFDKKWHHRCAFEMDTILTGENLEQLRSFREVVQPTLKLCELFMGLHGEGLIAGLLTPASLGFGEFHYLTWDVGALLCARRTLRNFIKAYLKNIKSDQTQNKQSGDQSIIDDNGCDPLLVTHHHPMLFTSPEVLCNMADVDVLSATSMTPKMDSWILGCILCESLYSKTPWEGLSLDSFLESPESHMQEAEAWMSERSKSSHLDANDWPMHFMRLLVKCFSRRPEDRPDILEIYNLLSHTTGDDLDQKGCTAPPNRESSYQNTWCLALEHNISAAHKTSAIRNNTIHMLSIAEPAELDDDKIVERETQSYLEGHTDYITALALCGEYLLSASFDRTICMWSLKDDTLFKTFKGHMSRVMALVTGEQGLTFISGDYGGEIRMWALECDTAILNWYHHQDWRFSGVASLAVSRDLVYSGGGDKVIKVWSMEDHSLVACMEGHKSVVSALLLDRGVLYSGSWDGTVHLWWCTDHSALCVLSGSMQLGAVRALGMARDLLLVGFQHGSIQVWKDETCLNLFAAHDGDISSFDLSEDKVFSASWDGSIKAWQAEALVDAPTPSRTRKCSSAVTSIVHTANKLYAGLGAKTIMVFANLADS